MIGPVQGPKEAMIPPSDWLVTPHYLFPLVVRGTKRSLALSVSMAPTSSPPLDDLPPPPPGAVAPGDPERYSPPVPRAAPSSPCR